MNSPQDQKFNLQVIKTGTFFKPSVIKRNLFSKGMAKNDYFFILDAMIYVTYVSHTRITVYYMYCFGLAKKKDTHSLLPVSISSEFASV